MQLDIQSIHFTADDKLVDYITKKTEKLNTYFERIIGGQVHLKLTKPQAPENKIVEIKINVPGNTLIAKEQADTFEAATDLATSSLKTQIRRYKEKLQDR